MGSTGYCGFGTTFAGATAGAIGQIRDIRGPNQTADDVDISNSGSTSAFKEFVKGMIDGGEVTVDLVYVKATGTTLETAMARRTNENWTITFSDSSTIVASGYLKAWSFDAPYKGEITCSLTIKFSGVPNFTAAA